MFESAPELSEACFFLFFAHRFTEIAPLLPCQLQAATLELRCDFFRDIVLLRHARAKEASLSVDPRRNNGTEIQVRMWHFREDCDSRRG